MKPRIGWMKAEVTPDGNINIQTGGDLTIAEMIFALDWAKDQVKDNARRGARGVLVPGMLTPDLKRVPGSSN